MKAETLLDTGQISFELKGEKLIADVLRALFWERENLLVVSDVHLGKAGHFRKNGIPIPRGVHRSDLEKLSLLVEKYEPRTLVFLGDLFHSDLNEEWDDFLRWSSRQPQLQQVLVEGNHDILNPESYAHSALQVLPELILPPFHFTHQIEQSMHYNLAGHVHPGVRLIGGARQTVSLPCFYFSSMSGLLPAFGSFTGKYVIKPRRGEYILAVANEQLIELVP